MTCNKQSRRRDPVGAAAPRRTSSCCIHQYLLALQQTSGLALRQFEHTLLIYLGLLPEIEQDADFYHLDLSGDTATLRPASRGYSRQNLTRLLSEHPDWQHPETRQLLQSLVRFYSHHRAETKKTAIALRQLLQPLPT